MNALTSLPWAILGVAIASGVGCGGDYFRFYDVVREASELCDIRPEGEFCGDEGLPPAEQEGWAIEREAGFVQVFVDEEVWRATEDPEDDTRLSASKTEISTSEPGPCTTTRVREISLVATWEKMNGTLSSATRIEGGEDCGASPRGERVTFSIDGVLLGTP